MSQVLLYHYNGGQAPVEHTVDNASAWFSGLNKLLGVERSSDRPNDEIVRRYNALQRSKAPDWRKIALGFIATHTLVLDEDRGVVSDSLYKAFEWVYDGRMAPSIKEVADKLHTIDSGPILITTSSDVRELEEAIVDVSKFQKALDHYHGDVPARELEDLLENHQHTRPIPVERILKMFQRPVPVPRYLKY